MRRLLRRIAGTGGTGRLAKRSGWALASTVVTTLAVFAETVILARELGPAVYGVFLLVLAVPEAVLGVLDLRVKDAMNKFMGAALATDDRRSAAALLKLFWLADVAVGLVCLLIVLALAGPIAGLVTDDPQHADLMRLYACGLFLGTLDSASGTMMRILDRFRLVFFASAFGMLLRLALVGGAALAGSSLETIVLARAIADVVFTIVLALAGIGLLKRLLWEHRRARISELGDERLSEIRSFLLSTNLAGTLKMASTKLDSILVGTLASPAALAVYKLALQFGKAPLLLSDALYVAAFPTFSRAVALGRAEQMRRVAVTGTRVMALALLPPGLVGALFGGEILELVGGSAYAGGGLVFALVVVSVLPYGVLFWLKPLLLSAGQAAHLLRAQAAGTAVQMALLVALVPPLGAEGAGIALAAGNLLVVALQARLVRAHSLLEVRPAHA